MPKSVTLKYKQINNGPPEKVFPLLCPVREKDWLDGWEYKMIRSKSGLVEAGCIFTTPHHGKGETIWLVKRHDPENFVVEFIRVTGDENVVQISIKLEAIDYKTTNAFIEYMYISLNDEQSHYLENKLEADFQESMQWWEKAINYYLETGEMLLKDPV